LDDLGITLQEGESIYNLVPADYGHMGLNTFEWLGEDEQGREISVGNWDAVFEAAKDYYQNLWDEMGVDGWNPSFIEEHLDTHEIERMFEEMYESMIEDDPQSYFDEEELPLSEEQQEEVEKLREELENLNGVIDTLKDENDIAGAEDRIAEIENEIDEISSTPEGEPTVGQIENMVENFMYEVRQDPISFLREYGFDVSDYVDVDALIETAINLDGVGPALSSYDGEVYESLVNGEWYYVLIVE
jgi:hypothetical protein